MQPDVESRIINLEEHAQALADALQAERRSNLKLSLIQLAGTTILALGLLFQSMPEQKPQQAPTVPGIEQKVGEI